MAPAGKAVDWSTDLESPRSSNAPRPVSTGRPAHRGGSSRAVVAAIRTSRGKHEAMVEHLEEMHAAMCKTTSNPVRLQMLSLLGKRELSVSVLARQLKHPIPTVSKHLQLMKDQGVVSARRDGNVIFYRVADQRILQAIELIREVLLSRMKRENAYLNSG